MSYFDPLPESGVAVNSVANFSHCSVERRKNVEDQVLVKHA